jgi:hypothetical protein
MTLYELVRKIERIASAQPTVNMIVENDIDKLNSVADAQYGIFAFVQGQHSSRANSDWVTYSLTLYYVDRLTEDGSNLLEVQSVGVQTLDNIVKDLAQSESQVVVENYSFQPFLHSFADNCAGVYMTVSIQTLRNTLCAEHYVSSSEADYNDDYNSDFFSKTLTKWGITKKVI